MDKSSKNYIPPVKMASAGGVMLNMSTVKSISADDSNGKIKVSYITGDTEEMYVNDPSGVVASLMEQMR